MELEEYDRIHELEEQHWRYRAIRRTLLSALRRHERKSGVRLRRILDAGCGPGGTTLALATLAPTVGVDVHPRALALARRRNTGPLVRASVSRLSRRSAAARRSTEARASKLVRRQESNAATPAASAACTSASVASGYSRTREPFRGSMDWSGIEIGLVPSLVRGSRARVTIVTNL